MERLGKYLLKRGLLSSEQLQEALQCKVIFAHRLGTSLVELGHLSVEELGRHLAAQTGVALPPAAWLARPEPAALKAVPRELADRHKLLPVRLDEGLVHVVMLDPLDQRQIDDVAFASSRRVQPYVLPELTLLEALKRHYGIQRRVRYIALGAEPVPSAGREGKKSEKKKEAAPPRRARGASRAEAAAKALGIRPLATSEELIDEDTFARLFQRPASGGPPGAAGLPGPGAAAAPHPPPEPPAVAPPPAAPRLPEDPRALEAELSRAADREAVADLAVRLACCFARTAALFLVYDGLIEGFRGSGDSFQQRVPGTLISTDVPSFLGRVANGASPYRGKPASRIDARVLRALGRAEAREVAVLPVRLRDRVVNLIYADNGAEPLAETALGALRAVGELVASAYERLVEEKRRQIEQAEQAA